MLQEILLDVASFLDYTTLVMLKLTKKVIRCVVERNAAKLAFRKVFSLGCSDNHFEMSHPNDPSVDRVVVKVDANDTERNAALAEVKSVIGPHDGVIEVELFGLSTPIKRLVDSVPGLRDASGILIWRSTPGDIADIVAFRQPQYLSLVTIPLEALIVIMNDDCSSKVSALYANAPENERESVLDANAEDAIVRFCMRYDNLRGNESKRVRMDYWNISWNFVERLAKALTESARTLTVTVRTPKELTQRSLDVNNGFSVSYWELPLSTAFFEAKCVGLYHFLRRFELVAHTWIKLAHYSRHSDVVVFADEYEVTITNNPQHIKDEVMYPGCYY